MDALVPEGFQGKDRMKLPIIVQPTLFHFKFLVTILIKDTYNK